ncbi:hypothetical protein [Actinacidiphila yeochonensis]|uniref:hypothetical protein n=1 Tax=Actinacidiphila yeochonensis TaxID=89050 RepID=UPI0012FECAE7|nr:hypothetical protein [Actinacidiphila yeochonensis]
MPSLRLRHRSRRFLLAAAVIALVTVGAAVTLCVLLTGGSHGTRVTADNISRRFRACLITSDPDQPAARASWAGLQEAARTDAVNSQRIVTPASARTAKELLPYVDSLVQRQCGLIVSAGPRLDQAIAQAAEAQPAQRFLTTGSPVGLPNTTALPDPTSADVAAAVRAASRPRSAPARSPAHGS